MPATYTYKRKDGGTTECYGEIKENSNFMVTCDNEYKDDVLTCIEGKTWKQVCAYLEEHYDNQIEQIEAV